MVADTTSLVLILPGIIRYLQYRTPDGLKDMCGQAWGISHPLEFEPRTLHGSEELYRLRYLSPQIAVTFSSVKICCVLFKDNLEV